MNVILRPESADDLDVAFDYYQRVKLGLGLELLDEFRRGVDKILEFPRAWQLLEDPFRRYRINRFPYGIVYRILEAEDFIVIVEFMHMNQLPRYRS